MHLGAHCRVQAICRHQQPAGAFEALVGLSALTTPAPPGAGGNGFDLADVGLAWARYVRIEGADFVPGGVVGTDNAGFDLDAVAALHSAPATDADSNDIPDAVE